MRILHADTDDLDHPLRGGQPVRTFAIDARLVAAGDHVTVFTASYAGSRLTVRGGVRYERLGLRVPYWGLSPHLTFLARLPAAIRRTPHDLVVEEFTPPFGFCAVERATTRPVVTMVQWFFFDLWTRRYRLPFETLMRRRAVRAPARNLIVQTDRMGAYFRELLPTARIHKVPCGIDRDAFSSVSHPGDHALFLGRLDIAQKGLDDLLAAWSSLARAGTAIPLWIAGAGPDEARLRAAVVRLGLERLVVFKGRLDAAGKQEALRCCRFLVMPSREETFGIVALEAMAASRPVIAYAIDHLDELLAPGWSVTVRRGDVEAFARAAAALWNNPAQAAALGLAGHAAAHDYLWDALAVRQREIYRRLVDEDTKRTASP